MLHVNGYRLIRHPPAIRRASVHRDFLGGTVLSMPLHLSPRPVAALRVALLAFILDVCAGVAASRGRAYLYLAVLLVAGCAYLASLIPTMPGCLPGVDPHWYFTPHD